MTYIDKTAFQHLVPAGDFDGYLNIPGQYLSDSSDLTSFDVCSAGFFVQKEKQIPVRGYESVEDGNSNPLLYNTNAWYMVDAADGSNFTNLYICDTHDIPYLADPRNGNVYAVGSSTLGLPSVAGKLCNYRKAIFDGAHIERFGEGNFSGSPAVGGFVVIDDGLWADSAKEPDFGAFGVIVGAGTFTEGAYNSFGYYDVMLCFKQNDYTGA